MAMPLRSLEPGFVGAWPCRAQNTIRGPIGVQIYAADDRITGVLREYSLGLLPRLEAILGERRTELYYDRVLVFASRESESDLGIETDFPKGHQ
jgi:hypothetical protein